MRAAENKQLSSQSMGNLVSSNDLARLQCEQHSHDLRNHFDIISLHKTDRLKHYGLHFAKYVGRLARESAEVAELLFPLSGKHMYIFDISDSPKPTPRSL